MDRVSQIFSRVPGNYATHFCRIDKNGCIHCGSRRFEHHKVITDDLAASWELSRRERDLFDQREGYICQDCQMSKRVRMLLWSLKRVCPNLKQLCILHLNQINHLSAALAGASHLVETTYLPRRAMGEKIDGLINADLCQLTFPDSAFDLVIHSETLEHVYDYKQAMKEVTRVLKPGGCQIYTVPLIHRRLTRQRIDKDSSGGLIQILPPSFHGELGEYPVVWEFGGDFIRNRMGPLCRIHYDNYWTNRTIFTVVEHKPDKY